MLIVQKYGGSSIATMDKIFSVAERIIDTKKKVNDVVVVLSAQGDTTDELINKTMQIDKNVTERELSMLLATGEQQSVALMTMAINKLGYSAVSLTGIQAGIYSTNQYTNARIIDIDTKRIKLELKENNIVVITGFQGSTLQGEITTLGRGGSDTTAVAIGAKLGARLCEIYTDVEGVYTADPRIIKNAVKLNEVSHDEMLELATLGAKVLHNRSVELARKYNITLEVRSSMSNNKGTIVKGSSSLESMVVSGIVVDTEVARMSLIGMKDEPGRAYKIFSTLSKAGICVDIIVQSIGRNRTKDITFTLPKSYLDEALNTLDCNRDFIAYDHYSYDDNIAKLSVVGAGMETNSGVASAMFEALYEKDINIHMISTSEIKISILVDKELAYAAANAIHDKFFINTIL